MTPASEHRWWAQEIERAGKREKDWRTEGEKIVERYRGEKVKQNSFNVLWSNTETLLPALYSDVPRQDVRRRFKDGDILGKIVAEVMSRCLQVSLDTPAFDTAMRASVLDALLPGRGVMRIRYVPSLSQVGVAEQAHEEDAEEPSHELGEGYAEELEYEQVVCEHVDWQDFRRGFGRCWDEVSWVGFRCRLSKDDVAKQFGEDVAEALQYDEEEDAEKKQNGQAGQQDQDENGRKTAEFWEVWDKDKRRVFFWCQAYQQALLFPLSNPDGAPPLEFDGFFPCPRPLQLVEDSSSLVPIPLWRLYEQQARELDDVSRRINRLIAQCKVRGIYDSRLSEISRVMQADDGEMAPVENAAAMATVGGLDKAVSWFPVDQIIKVLEGLYKNRDQAKETIYEITGLSDIVRGASQASETATAQQIKSQYVSLRLKRMRAAVEQYARQAVRMMAEVVAERFSTDTLAQMSGLSLMTAAEKQQAMMMAQAMEAAGMPPQQPDPRMQMPSWEDVAAVMRSDMARTFKVDVETDSMIASTADSDMRALSDLVSGLTNFWGGIAPMVQAGALPMEAVKAISLAICRRARLGTEVADAIEDMKQPEPPAPQPDPLEQEKLAVEREKITAERERAQTERQEIAMEAQMKREEHAMRMREMQSRAIERAMVPEVAGA